MTRTVTLHIWTEYQQSNFAEAKGRTVRAALMRYGIEGAALKELTAQLTNGYSGEFGRYSVRRA